MKRLFALVIATALMIGEAQAQDVRAFVDGNSLLKHCKNRPRTACAAYVAGVADAVAVDSVHGYHACIPNNVTIAQTADVVKLYLERNPQDRHVAAVALVAQALSEAFPCR